MLVMRLFHVKYSTPFMTGSLKIETEDVFWWNWQGWMSFATEGTFFGFGLHQNKQKRTETLRCSSLEGGGSNGPMDLQIPWDFFPRCFFFLCPFGMDCNMMAMALQGRVRCAFSFRRERRWPTIWCAILNFINFHGLPWNTLFWVLSVVPKDRLQQLL